MLRAGMFLQDRYEILEKIGSGGMSDVYKARCHKLNRLVAIKVLKEEFSSDANFVSKFKMEAQAAARLSHPNIVSVYDVVDEGDMHYIVMELIEGVTLKKYIGRKGYLEYKECIGIAIQVAQGIAAAHEQHIIHRDIKPQNMIISRDGKVKVADFGIARAVSAQTLSSAAMGSVHYISPEQAKGSYSDARSDIYSLGITMYEMVTGRVPFEGDNTVAVALAHLEEPIIPPSTYNPGIPRSLESIILKCTEKRPERRYGTTNEVISDLRRALIAPEEDFVRTAPPIDVSQTQVISLPDLARIREGRNPQPPAGWGGGYEEEGRTPGKGTKGTPGRKGPSSSKKRKNKDADLNPKVERLITAAGIIMAIIIIGVVVVIFSKVGGLFKAVTQNQPTSQATESVSGQQPSDVNAKQVHMPDVVNLAEDMARAKLKDSSLDMKITGYDFSDTIEKGYVMAQDVEKDAVVNKYSSVGVTISKGPQNPEIDLKGMGLSGVDQEAAQSLLAGKGLVVTVENQSSDTVPQGKVMGISPDQAKAGDQVTLTVSSGPETKAAPVAMPDLKGQSQEEADKLLTGAGLQTGNVVKQPSDTVAPGQVIDQGIVAGAMVNPGTPVDYSVSTGPEHKDFKYVAAIDTKYSLEKLIGPGSGSTSINVKMQLKQVVNGAPVYRDLIGPVKVQGNVTLPISINNIEGAYGVTSGELELVNVDTGKVITSFPLTFIPVPNS